MFLDLGPGSSYHSFMYMFPKSHLCFNKNSVLFKFPDQSKTESPTIPLRCVVFSPLDSGQAVSLLCALFPPSGVSGAIQAGMLWEPKVNTPLVSASLSFPYFFKYGHQFPVFPSVFLRLPGSQGSPHSKKCLFVLVLETLMSKPP